MNVLFISLRKELNNIYETKIKSLRPPSIKFLAHKLNLVDKAYSNKLLKNCGNHINKTTASPKPKIKDNVPTKLIRLTLSFSANHFSNLDGSPSPKTSAERNKTLVPPTIDETNATTPRTIGNFKKKLRSFCGFNLFVSSRITPSASRTAVAIEDAPRIMTPSNTA